MSENFKSDKKHTYVMEYKTCIKCHVSKPPTEFYRKTNRCKGCAKEYQKEYRINKQTPAQKMRRYLTKSLKNGRRHRVGLNYILEMPTEDCQKCTTCQKWKPIKHFRTDQRPPRRGSYHRTICIECDGKTKKLRQRIRNILEGDGCCLYCGTTDFWLLNNHHIFGRTNSDFTITLCENHHAPFTRGLPFVLTEWHQPVKKSNT